MSGWQEINIVFLKCSVSRELGINSVQVENSIFSGPRGIKIRGMTLLVLSHLRNKDTGSKTNVTRECKVSFLSWLNNQYCY